MNARRSLALVSLALAVLGVSATATAAVTWTQRGTDIDGAAAWDTFGTAVALSADGAVLAVGAPLNDGAAGADSGHVRTFTWDGSAWTSRGGAIEGESADDQFGQGVALSADGLVLAVGAPRNDGGAGGADSGHVRVYAWSGSAWVRRGGDIEDATVGARSGTSVALSADGSVLAIGAPNHASGTGQVVVYTWNGSTWLPRGSAIDGEATGDDFGVRVALSADGSVLAAGAPSNDGAPGIDSGQARVYAWSGTGWVQRGGDIDGEAAADYSGLGVALSDDGSVLAVGAPDNDGGGFNSGHVRIFAWSGTAWTQRGADIDGEAASDAAGTSVSLSGDGGVVAVGANGNDGTGSTSGHVRVLGWTGTAWAQRGSDLDGEAANDQSGYAVSLSRDGSLLAVGAKNNSATGSFSGHVRVYGAPPEAPSAVTATAASAQALVSWAGPANGDALTRYIVSGSPAGSCSTTGTRSCTVTGLANGTAYTFSVTATNAAGTSAASAASAAVTPSAAPGAPTAVAATAGRLLAVVRWTAPTDAGGTAITGYTATANPGGRTCTTETTTCTITGLLHTRRYTISVTATNAAGSSVASMTATVRPYAALRMRAPRAAGGTITSRVPVRQAAMVTQTVTTRAGARACRTTVRSKRASTVALTCPLNRTTRKALKRRAQTLVVTTVVRTAGGASLRAVHTLRHPATRAVRSRDD